jgi:hypothetical protein
MLSIILLAFAFVFAVLATFKVGEGRWLLGWASLACFYASLIFGSLHIGAALGR